MEYRKIVRGCLYAVSVIIFCVNGNAYASSQDAFDELDQTDADTGDWNKPKEVTVLPPERTVIIREVIRVERVVEKEPERRVLPVVAPSPRSMPVARAERPVSRVVPTETGSGILFEFKKCSKRGNDLECHFNMTSQYFDRKISFGGNGGRQIVTFYDDVGNSYKYSKVKVASKEVERPYNWSTQLISDVSTNAVFYFKNISSQARSISKFEIGSAANKSGHWEKFVLTFRDLNFHVE